MPRRVRNPGSGKPPCNGPAKGAGHGGPASGIPAGGDGWGGPAKGAQPPRGPQPFGPDNPAPPRYRTPEELAARKTARDQDAANAFDKLVALLDSKTEATVLAAAREVMARVEGTPTTTTRLTGPGGGPIETRE